MKNMEHVDRDGVIYNCMVYRTFVYHSHCIYRIAKKKCAQKAFESAAQLAERTIGSDRKREKEKRRKK